MPAGGAHFRDEVVDQEPCEETGANYPRTGATATIPAFRTPASAAPPARAASREA